MQNFTQVTLSTPFPGPPLTFGPLRGKTRAQLSLGLVDRTHGAHSQPASITVRVYVSNMLLPAPEM